MRCGFPEERWYDLGLRLRVDKSKLDTIETCYHHSSRCLTESLSLWLHEGGATLDLLSDALRSMNENAVADKLDQESELLLYINVNCMYIGVSI